MSSQWGEPDLVPRGKSIITVVLLIIRSNMSTVRWFTHLTIHLNSGDGKEDRTMWDRVKQVACEKQNSTSCEILITD